MVSGGVLPETTPAAVAVVVAATGLIRAGNVWLEGAAERLSAQFGLPAVVQGSIVAIAAGLLTLSTVLRFTLLRTDLVLTDAESYALLAA
ncbi:hypothetical protein BRC75_05185 [Halobacteriales archaeon QH_7_69_31]|nr:MAG: hypothetical protein BRC75_05185 [Halobacteriales archaeon QH_7_69_31]